MALKYTEGVRVMTLMGSGYIIQNEIFWDGCVWGFVYGLTFSSFNFLRSSSCGGQDKMEMWYGGPMFILFLSFNVL